MTIFIFSSEQHSALDAACTVNFCRFLLRLTNKCAKYLLTLIYFFQLQRVSVPKYHHQGAVHMLQLQANKM